MLVFRPIAAHSRVLLNVTVSKERERIRGAPPHSYASSNHSHANYLECAHKIESIGDSKSPDKRVSID